jgi:hypothetical protein
VGYKSILIFERAYLFEKGRLIFERNLPKTADSKDEYIGQYVVLSSKPQHYKITSWGGRELVTCEIKVNAENKLSIDSFKDLESAEKIAKEYSIKDNAKCIVCQVLDYVNWH